MLSGNRSQLALESQISEVDERLGLRALGFFVIWVGGTCYGVREPDATWLACSFDEVRRRIERRNAHNLFFADEFSAEQIAIAYRHAFYFEYDKNEVFCGLPVTEFKQNILANHIVWAPDGDAAFDDGGYVLHIDDHETVRLIAFRSLPGGPSDMTEFNEIRLAAEDFSDILQKWSHGFETEWQKALNAPLQ